MDKKYKTKDGEPVRILCVDKPGEYPVVGLIGSSIHVEVWTLQGQYYEDKPYRHDLVEVSEWDDFKIDEPVMVRDSEKENWKKAHFAGVSCRGYAKTWQDGETSWTSDASTLTWKLCRKPTAEELGNK